MGHVFKGTDRKLNRVVAFKVLAPDLATAVMAERFKREARRLAKLHAVPNIVQVYDADTTPDGLLYFVMEFVNGSTLQKVLKEEGALPPARVCNIGVQLLTALEGAHALGITHRDIKPANIFLRGKQALLGDFGIASAADSEETTLTGEGARIGTLAYMSPEQLHADAVGPRSDLFSFGLVLRECLTGQETTIQTREARDAWDGVPRGTKPVLERALARDPQARWENAVAFREALEEAIPATTRHRLPRAVSALLAAIGFLFAVLVTLAFGDIIRAWIRAQACRVVHLSHCAPPLRVNDLAILPFVAPEGSDDGYTLALQVAQRLEGTTRIKVAPGAQTSDWWDSLPPRKRSTPPTFAHYYTEAGLTRSAAVLGVKLALDSAGRTYERFSVTADTSAMDALSYSLADSIVCQGPFRRDCADFRSFLYRPAGDQVRAEFFAGKEAVQRGNWAAAEAHFREALDRDSMFMSAAWELMIAKRIQRKDFSADLRFIARNIDSLPPFYRRLAIASLTPDLRERFRLFRGGGT